MHIPPYPISQAYSPGKTLNFNWLPYAIDILIYKQPKYAAPPIHKLQLLYNIDKILIFFILFVELPHRLSNTIMLFYDVRLEMRGSKEAYYCLLDLSPFFYEC